MRPAVAQSTVSVFVGRMLKRAIKKALHTAGLEISHYAPSSRTVLEDVLRKYAVDTILDVGANTGQSGAAD